jgi:hypothetical protein
MDCFEMVGRIRHQYAFEVGGVWKENIQIREAYARVLANKNLCLDQMPHKTRKVGSRAQVMHGTAEKTKGGLTKKNLKYNKYGRIVSAKKSARGHHLK